MPTPIYAIGDIHGFQGQLDRALNLIELDGGGGAKTVFLGDFTDRGPDSRAVIDTLIDGQTSGQNWVFLKGNHDRMFDWFMENPPRHDPYMLIEYSWLHQAIGGITTLGSYGVDAGPRRRLKDVHADACAAVPQSHVDFLRGLRLSFETNDLFFAHAGIRPGIALADQDEEDLLWIRQEFHNYQEAHPKLIVHGHTPVRAATHYGNRVNLDSGAGFGQDLSVAVFDEGAVYLLNSTGRRKLDPISL